MNKVHSVCVYLSVCLSICVCVHVSVCSEGHILNTYIVSFIADKNFFLGLKRELIRLKNFKVKQIQEENGKMDGSVTLECTLGISFC